MRKLICLVTVLLLCMSFALSAFATEGGFVPSITYKPEPEIQPVVGENGEEYIGVLRNAEGEIVGTLEESCLIVTPIAHVWDPNEAVPKEIEELLLFVYEGLSDGKVELPYSAFAANLDAANMVIRDLFDVRLNCEECEAALAIEGVTLELTFDLGIVADVQVYVASFDEETGKWEAIVSAVNNGDGTVTCTFEHLCAVSVAMPLATASAPVVEATSNSNVTPWIIVLVAAVAAVAGVVIVKGKKKTAA